MAIQKKDSFYDQDSETVNDSSEHSKTKMTGQ